MDRRSCTRSHHWVTDCSTNPSTRADRHVSACVQYRYRSTALEPSVGSPDWARDRGEIGMKFARKGIMVVFFVVATIIAPVTQVNAAPTASADQVFANRVATFNVCNPCRWRPSGGGPGPHIDKIVDQIATYRAQVIALQEICTGEAEVVLALLAARGIH